MENFYLIASVAILATGALICFYLIFRSRRKVEAIKHYEKIRDKLSLRKIVIEKESQNHMPSILSSLRSFMPCFIVILVGVSLVQILVDEMKGVCNQQMNVTNVVESILCKDVHQGTEGSSIVVVFFCLGIVIAGLGGIFNALRDSGLILDNNYNNNVKEARAAIKHYKKMTDALGLRREGLV